VPFWVFYYHVVWATKDRQPLITPDVETCILTAMHEKSQALECAVHAANTVLDHIHIAVSIVPRIAVSEWVRHIKGYTAHEVNAHFPHLTTHFRWQGSYGAQTFGTTHLPFVTAYIANQKQRHRDNQLEPYLERDE
jgi:putative transposase